MSNPELGTKKVAELREMAKQLGVAGVEGMKKDQLIAAIIGDAGPKADPTKDATPKRKRIKKNPEETDLFSTPNKADKPVKAVKAEKVEKTEEVKSEEVKEDNNAKPEDNIPEAVKAARIDVSKPNPRRDRVKNTENSEGSESKRPEKKDRKPNPNQNPNQNQNKKPNTNKKNPQKDFNGYNFNCLVNSEGCLDMMQKGYGFLR